MAENFFNKRQSGILLHISSLPSTFGIGDFGKTAYQFADFLKESGQKLWQVLPFNPVIKKYGFSPYSSSSVFAGNTLFVNPDMLLEDGLVEIDDLKGIKVKSTGEVDYIHALSGKKTILDKAYSNFIKGNFTTIEQQFKEFFKNQSHWLDDFILYCIIQEETGIAVWYDWPEMYKFRYREALDMLKKKFAEDYDKHAFCQFLFHRQWKLLKDYCNNAGIKIVGDLPIYVSHESVDVWTYPQYFSLDTNFQMKFIAGVPPDYFSADGQLWDMPVFEWKTLKKHGYDWWIKRLSKNFELFDIVRLDHFRGFSEYWAVPANEKTARNGSWLPGPGEGFFKVVQKKLKKLPIIAEDLGDISQDVYALRDKFSLPGMQVLQFAFGNDFPDSIHLPHNHKVNSLVYTGTHDNLPIKGWYKMDLTGKHRNAIKRYTGTRVNRFNCHWKFIRLAYCSVANSVIIPMQDVLGLGAKSAMNIPSVPYGNWLWKMKTLSVDTKIIKRLKTFCRLYNR